MNRRLIAIVSLLLIFSPSAYAASIVQQPDRAFGYVIGDQLEQRILLQQNGKQVELTQVPELKRVGPWLQRQASNLINDDQGQVWLQLRYQIINAPTGLISTSLPELNLNLSNSEVIKIDAWPFSLSALIPSGPEQSSIQPSIRPDRLPVLYEGDVVAQRLSISLIALLVTLLGWAGWWFWRQRSDIKRLPFAQAWHQLRTLNSSGLDENPQAWLLLHHAFNHAAGKAINNTAINELIRLQPWLSSLQSRIEVFYAVSAARFFEQSAQPQKFELRELGRELFLAEKRNSVGSIRVNQ